MTHDLDAGTIEDLHALIEDSVAYILRTEDAGRFLAWMRDEAITRYPRVFDQILDDRGRRLFAFLFGRSIWNATPLPGNRFRPRPLPGPAPAAPCPCGSMLPYRRCCRHLPTPDFQVRKEDLFFSVLQHVPDSALQQVPRSALSRPALALLALRWVEAGEIGRAVKLLEPIFRDPCHLDDEDDLGFDTLLDCYAQLGRRRKQRELIDRVAQGNSRPLRAIALQRQCMAQADRDDMDGAWQTYRQALRECPEHPSHGQLELVLLIGNGELQMASERARFLLAGVRRQGYPADHPLCSFYGEVIRDPLQAMVHMAAATQPALGCLHELLRGAASAKVAARYQVLRDPRDPHTGWLCAPSLFEVERDWQKVWLLPKPTCLSLCLKTEIDVWDPAVCAGWLRYLLQVPQAFDSVTVLDDLCQAALHLGGAGTLWMDTELLLPILRRTQRIVEGALSQANDQMNDPRIIQGADPPVRLPWRNRRNRPLLRLLCHMVRLRRRRGEVREAQELLQLVLRLNPADEHRLRHELAQLLLYDADDEALLQLAAPYGDEHDPELVYGKVLALYRLGRLPEAAQALAAAQARLPLVFEYLVQRRPRRPLHAASELLSDEASDDEQAWNYRLGTLPLWQRTPGGLSWLRSREGNRPGPPYHDV